MKLHELTENVPFRHYDSAIGYQSLRILGVIFPCYPQTVDTLYS